MNFGLATIKEEGGKLMPSDYLKLNGDYPLRSFYTQEELNQFDEFQLSFIADNE